MELLLTLHANYEMLKTTANSNQLHQVYAYLEP